MDSRSCTQPNEVIALSLFASWCFVNHYLVFVVAPETFCFSIYFTFMSGLILKTLRTLNWKVTAFLSIHCLFPNRILRFNGITGLELIGNFRIQHDC